MPVLTDRAIVLRTAEYSETSQTLALFTEQHGLVRLLAKGVKRSTRTRIAVGLDLLELGDASFAPPRGSAGLGALTEWMQRDAFPALRRSTPCLYAGLYAAERIPALTAELDPHPGLFRALLELLQTVSAIAVSLAGRRSAGPNSIATALARFQAALLRAIGYAPDLRRCGKCGKSRTAGGSAFFSGRYGGLLCRTCARDEPEKRRVPQRMLGGPSRQEMSEAWFDLLDYYLTYLAGRPARTAGLLRQMIAAGQRQDRQVAPDART